MTDYSDLERLRDAGTAGPWRVVPYGNGDHLVIHDARADWRVCFMATPGSSPGAFEQIVANAALIVAAVNAVKPMLAELRAKDAQIEALVARIAELEAGLRPFAEVCTISTHPDNWHIDDTLAATKVTWGHLRTARTLLNKDTDNGE